QVLAGSVTGDPLFVLIDRPEGKVVVLTVNLDLGDLPFRTAFPILAMNTLGFFTGSGELRESLPTGATAEVTLPAAGAFVLGRPAWWYLVGLAWLLAAAEWYLYQRRWIS